MTITLSEKEPVARANLRKPIHLAFANNILLGKKVQKQVSPKCGGLVQQYLQCIDKCTDSYNLQQVMHWHVFIWESLLQVNS